MALSELEELAKRHGALSYRNRADTQNPAFGFSAAGLASLVAEVRKADTELIRQMLDVLEDGEPHNAQCGTHWWRVPCDCGKDAAITAARARLADTK